ncbi:calpain family cysteine protease (macronuclear) [Tetrahymena thermophila SB210]|uniref:Calpain family cysteine protease n=1 Tax=Tetrahymena thermophila (strain SB210) TaxID=312017 RepID=I7M6I1_TETTS|nr:calpain family cysteine protease [Tetrahymena thermophila SB210]EAR85246.2 calpain family cysteine protease [Tetrahymena thermophila SB210]|eukprot:XP_001032909.2 calpain family cysteine protease [Tetrahymena thermophila SB210]
MSKSDQDYQEIPLQKDIILQKKKAADQNQYEFKLINRRLNIIEFIADFSESRGIELKESVPIKAGSNGQDNVKDIQRQSKIQKTIIQPRTDEIVCIVKIIDSAQWELKSKFKYIIKPAPKEKQKDTIKEHDEEKKRIQEEERLAPKLKILPLSILTTGECLHYLKQILEKEKKKNDGFSKYIDPYFLPINDSIFGENDGSAFDTLIQWRRPENIFENTKEIRVFPSKINVCDIIPGQLSNFWFLSSVALLAEKQECIKRLFLTQDINEQGFYRVKICKNGEWQSVNVDDYFPCYPLDGPIFSHIDSQQDEDQSDISKSSNNNCHQTWLLILEKAYAKIHGDYFKLKNGSQKKCENALIDLTGCPVEKIKIDSNSEIQTIENYKNKRGYLMNLQKEDKQKDTTGYAYYIIRLENYDGTWLFNIRDIWENLQWEGDWSNHSELWDDKARKQLNPDLNDPKQTWMKFENVKEQFKFVNICKIQDWNEVRIKGKFVKVVDTNDSSIETFMSKWYYQFEVTENCLQKANNNIEVIITLHQEDELIMGVEDGRPYLDVQLALFQLVSKKGYQNENDYKKKQGNDNDYYKRLHHTKFTLIKVSDNQFQHERQIQLSFQIEEKGIYIILPRTNGLGFRESKKSKMKSFLRKKNDKQSNKSGQNQENKAENQRLAQLVESTLLDIFRKFDMRLTRKMSEQQFVAFKYCMEENQADEQEFRKEFYDLLEEYPSPDKCLSQEGFIQYMTEKIKNDQNQNIDSFLAKFKKIGYDESLYSIRSRCFIISLHSDVPLEVIVRDAIETDLDQRAARHIFHNTEKETDQIITQFNKDFKYQGGDQSNMQAYVYAQYYKEANYTTFIAKNQMRDKAIEVIFDLQKAKNDLILSTGRSNLKKKVEFKPPKQKEIKDPNKKAQGNQDVKKRLSKNSNNISIEVLFHMRGPYKPELETFRRICQIKECED